MGKKVKQTAVSISKNSTGMKKTVKPKAVPARSPGKTKVSVPAKPAPVSTVKKTGAPSVKKTAVPAPVVKPVKKKTILTVAARPKMSFPGKALSGKTLKKGTGKRLLKEEPLRKLKLSKADKKFFYDLLMSARSAFGEQIKFHSDEVLSSRKDSAGERAGMATHMADLGTDNFRHDFELGLMSEEVDVLEMVDEALQRLEDSEYGICLDCGDPIPRARLEAKPYAKYCTKCKSRREEMDNSRR